MLHPHVFPPYQMHVIGRLQAHPMRTEGDPVVRLSCHEDPPAMTSTATRRSYRRDSPPGSREESLSRDRRGEPPSLPQEPSARLGFIFRETQVDHFTAEEIRDGAEDQGQHH